MMQNLKSNFSPNAEQPSYWFHKEFTGNQKTLLKEVKGTAHGFDKNPILYMN
jgi:hypothetical protein